MPGTFASAIATIISYFMINLYEQNFNIVSFFLIFIIGQVFIVIVLKNTTKKDPSYVVVDELLGIFITFILFFYFFDQYSHFKYSIADIKYYIIGFALFRFFDILKPYPIFLIDKESKYGSYNKQAFFIIMDDIMAGSISAYVMHVIFKYIF